MNEKTIDFLCEIKAEESGYFKGYASTFGGDPDSYGYIVLQGAFLESIANGGRNKSGVAMLWQHNASYPIGAWQALSENNAGLKVEGQLAIQTTLGKDVYELTKLGAIKGLSIGYDAIESEPGKGKIKRQLKKVDLWEISLVTFPANRRATISQVKNMISNAKSPRELEEGFISLGMCHTAAEFLVSKCKESLLPKYVPDEEKLLTSLQKVNAYMDHITCLEAIRNINGR